MQANSAAVLAYKRSPSGSGGASSDVYKMDLATMKAKLLFENPGGFFPGDVLPNKRYVALSKITTITSTNPLSVLNTFWFHWPIELPGLPIIGINLQRNASFLRYVLKGY